MRNETTTERIATARPHNRWTPASGMWPLLIFLIGCSSTATIPRGPISTQLHNPPETKEPKFPPDKADQAARMARRVVQRITSQSPGLTRDLNGQVHIAIAPLLNRSTAPDHTIDLLADRLAATIREAGIPQGLVFHTPDEMSDPSTLDSPRPYLMYGEVFAIRKNDVRYWEIFFAIDRTDPTRRQPRRKVWDSQQGFLIRR